MKKLFFTLFFVLVFTGCSFFDKDTNPQIIDSPNEITARAFEFAVLYKESGMPYEYGGQTPVRAAGIDCSGLVVMCYKYAIVDTKYHLIESDMSTAYMYDNSTTHKNVSELRKGDLVYLGPENEYKINHMGLYSHIENGNIYFIDSTQKDTNGDGIDDINGVTLRYYPENDKHFKGFGVMRLAY